jgi:hypothetical protein
MGKVGVRREGAVLDKRQKAIPFFLDPSLKRLIHRAILFSRNIRVVSYPKSGRTWLRVMLHELSIDARFTHTGIDKKGARKRAENICDGIDRYFQDRIIFIRRDPRDGVVSYYHDCRRRNLWNGSLKEFIRAPEFGIERIVAFNRGWLARKTLFKNFLEVAYEDMRAKSSLELRRIVYFTGCPFVSDSAIEECVENHSFNCMKRREKSGELNQIFGERFTKAGTRGDHMMVRRGVVGGYVDEMDQEDRAFCMTIIANEMDSVTRAVRDDSSR